jgi:two-component system, OmpR family, sensor histidine kinase KdpD
MDENQHQRAVDIPFALPLLMVDSDMIARVIVNLLENAAKYTAPGGNILVSAALLDGKVQINILDTGPGISEPLTQKIFDKDL